MMSEIDEESSSSSSHHRTVLESSGTHVNSNSMSRNARTTFSSIWNSVKHGFHSTFATRFNINSPICLLGQFYHIKMADSPNHSAASLQSQCTASYVFEQFKSDFEARIWLTYRREFPSLAKSDLTSDTGWGCMIRSGQMILAQALSLHFIGRNWQWKDPDTTAAQRMIVQWFLDSPNNVQCPFSLHELVKIGEKTGKRPGDWFGPSSISFVLKAAIEKAAENIEELNDLTCYIAQDCTIYLQDLIEQCTGGVGIGVDSVDLCSSSETTSTSVSWKSAVILIPARLGTKHFNDLYSPHVKQILSLPQCIGIIGGKPRHSLYFIGFQDDKLVYLDPHYCQRAIDVSGDDCPADFSLDSFHCQVPRKTSMQSIDPSCAIGFYIKSRKEFDDFLDGIQQILEHTRQANDYPVFIVNEGKSCQFETEYDTQTPEKVLTMKYRLVDSMGNVQKIISAEEFILL